jgi:hypothetical protein
VSSSPSPFFLKILKTFHAACLMPLRLPLKFAVQVDGELRSRTESTAMAFGCFRGSGLDPAERDHRLPGLSAGLAAMVAVIANRSMFGFLSPIPLARTPLSCLEFGKMQDKPQGCKN